MRGTLLAGLLIGCSFTHGDYAITAGDASIDLDVLDAPFVDPPVDTPPDAECFGGGLFIDCYPNGLAPTGSDTPTGTLDTGNPASCTRVVAQSGGPELCLRSAGTITIASYVRARGPRPLVLLATDTIEITSDGILDASSFDGELGPGGNTGDCANAGTGGANTSNAAIAGAGGGGGAGFGTAGAVGGDGKNVGGGPAGATAALTMIRGGCRGGRGGTSSAGAGGNGGNGGGAVYLIAGAAITVAGEIRANGDAGEGGPNKAGGGGGGAGGLIAFDAPALTITGMVFANGGGGGEGGGGGQTGNDGSIPLRYDQRAGGGSGNTAGGNGGEGSVFDATGTPGTTGNNGGGGGGGGAGRIEVYQTSVPPGQISPPAT